MLEVKECVTPSPEQWQIVIHGMRNAYKSWNKSDSTICRNSEELDPTCDTYPYVDHWEDEEPYSKPICYVNTEEDGAVFVLGKADQKLMKSLVSFGPSDRKLLRQLPIIMSVKAPLYWWKQADKYQIGTVTNSESTMHTITKSPFTVDDFSIEHAPEIIEPLECGSFMNEFIAFTIRDLNFLRGLYLEFHNDKYKKLMIELLPESYFQTRLWSLNYEVALAITEQRYNHDLEEWHTLIQFFLDNLPYFTTIVSADGDLMDRLIDKGYKLNDLSD